MNLTVFTGTFNPIHIAHLIVAEFVRTELNAEKILFIPSFIPPHREDNIASPEHRLNMVMLATKNNPFFEVSDIELKLGEVSYTFNTIQELYRQNPEIKSKINFIIGADAFNYIETWYKYKELVKLINFIVLVRPNYNIKNNYNYEFIETPEIDISSSLIRQRIKEKKSVKYLVADEVEKYIAKNKLYLTL